MLDLNLWFIFTPITSASVGEFRHVCLCSEMSEKLKKRQIFPISQLKTNCNCAFQQTSDCRLIFSYETETEVNEANCVYQHFWTKEKKPTQFWREFFAGTNWGKLLQLCERFLKLLVPCPGNEHPWTQASSPENQVLRQWGFPDPKGIAALQQ